MSFNIGVLNAAVTLDDSDYKSRLSGLEVASNDTFKRIATMAAGYLTLRGLFSFVKQTTMEFSELENAVWNFDQTFSRIPATAAQVEAQMRSLYKLSEQASKNMLTNAAGQLKAFGVETMEALRMAEVVAKRGIDLASYKGGSQEEAVADIVRAMIGETEGMKKWGVVIRQSSREFEDLVKSIKNATGATDLQAKAQAILQIILEQTVDAEGDYLKEGANIAQTLNNITQATKTATASMGEHLASGIRPLLETYGSLLNRFNELDPANQKTIMQLAAMAAGMLLLQTSTGKALNAKLKLAAVNLVKGGAASQAKAEAAAVAAAEEQKIAAYKKTDAYLQARQAMYAARDARQNTRLALANVAGAQLNLTNIRNSGGSEAQLTVATKALVQAKRELLAAQSAEAKSLANLRTMRTAATVSTQTHATATRAAAAASQIAAKSSTVLGRAQLALTAGFTRAATGAKAFFAALGPLGWAMLAITAVTGVFNAMAAAAERAAREARKATDAARAATENNDESNSKRVGAMERLEELSKYERLSSNEQQEAQRLMDEIGLSYDKHGIRIDEVTGKILTERDAIRELITARKEELRQKRLETIEKEAGDIRKETETLNGQMVGVYSWRNWLNPGMFDSGTEYNTPLLERIEELNERMRELADEAEGLHNQTRDIGANPDDQNAAATQRNREQRRAQMRLEQSRWETDYGFSDTARKMEMIVKKQAELREELFQSAGNKKESEYSIEELEIAQRLVDLERQRQELRKSSADEFVRERESFAQAEITRARNNAQRATERQIGRLERDGDSFGAQRLVELELTKAQEAANALKHEYERVRSEAEADGVRTDDEVKRVAAARRLLEEALSDEDTWRTKLQDMEDQDRVMANVAGAWSTDVLNAMLGSNNPALETARYTRESARTLREIKEQNAEGAELEYE